MVLKPGTDSFGTVCRCQVLLEKWNLHLHKIGQQQEAWSALKLPGIRLCWPWTSEKHSGPTPADDMATPNNHWLWKLYTGPQATWIMWLSSPLFLQTLGLWFPKEMQNLLSSENITLDHSAAVQSFLSLARRDASDAVCCSRVAWHKECDSWKPMSCIRLCVVVLEALTPAAVHSLWISPTFLNGFCFTILSRVRLSLLLVHFFLPHLFLPFASLLMCLDTELCEQPASFGMTFCVLPSLCKLSMVVFGQLSSQQSSLWLCSLQN